MIRATAVLPTLLVQLSLAVATAATATTAAFQVAAGGGIDPEHAAEVFREAERLCGADDGALWGESLCGPLLLVEPGTRAAAASRADAEGRLESRGGVFVGTLPSNVPVANTALSWAGVYWAMVIWPLPEDEYDRGRLLMHESWHRIQERIGLPGTNPANAHLEELGGRYLLRLEWRALAMALEGSGRERDEAIRDAFAFRALRLKRYPGAAGEERELMLHEGLAEYTGVVLAAPLLVAADASGPAGRAGTGDEATEPVAPDAATGDEAADLHASDAATGDVTAEPDGRDVRTGHEATEPGARVATAPAQATAVEASPAMAAARARVAAALREAESGRTFARSFAYASGPAYGLLLDAADPEWRARIDRDTDLPDLLAEALGYSREEIVPADVEARAAAYGSDLVRAEEVERDRVRRERIAAYTAMYVDGPVLELRLAEPRISFHPHQVEPLGEVGAVYGAVRTIDRWGTLDAPGGALISFENGRIRVPAPADPRARPLRGHGWTLELEDGWGLEPGERKGDFVVVRRQENSQP